MNVIEETPVVIRDWFPATVTGQVGPWRTARVVLTRERLLVYLSTAGPVLDAAWDPAASTLPAPSAGRYATARITLASGVVVAVAGQRGCGCGNPLKSWRPWTPYRRAPA